MADLGKVAITPGGKWVTGLIYEKLTAVTHNENLYLSLIDTAKEPENDGVNWMLILEGVPIATAETAGKVKPDGETITADEDGTLHSASQVPEGVTFVDLEAESEELPEKVKVNADQLGGQNPEYYATAENLDKIVSGETVVGKATDADTVDGYHASDLPYLPLTGGMLTGRLTISPPAGIPDIFLQNNTTGTIGALNSNSARQVNMFNLTDGTLNNYTTLVLSAHDAELAKLLRLTRTVDGTQSVYKVFGEHNSKRFIENTTAPTDTTAAWIDTANKVIKSYIDGAWTPVS